MMKLSDERIGLYALILFSAWLFIGLPWLLAPTERVVYYENQQALAGTAESGSQTPPLRVQMIKSAEERTHESEDRAEKRIADQWLVRWTAVLGIATSLLIVANYFAARAAYRQAQILTAVESPMPLIAGFKLAQYAQIPGETVVVDPVLPGPILNNCRLLFLLENKGRYPVRMTELCIERHIGTTLPASPQYSNVEKWNLVLEKGPIWIRGTDPQIVITPQEVNNAAAAFANNGAFWVYGYFAYRDLFGSRVEHKFLARWDQASGFVGESRPKYT